MSLFPSLSDAFRAAAVSRRSRLDFVDANALLLVVRDVVFGFSWGWSREHMVAVVKHLAGRQSEEAVWLMGVMTSDSGEILIPTEELWGASGQGWLAKTLARDTSLFYRAQLLDGPFGRANINLFEQAAEAGYVPAMTELAWRLSKSEEKLAWFERAAALHDPDALNEMADRDEPNALALHLEAATRGNTGSMEWLFDFGPDCPALSSVQRAVWSARRSFLTSGNRVPRNDVREVVQRLTSGKISAQDVCLAYNVGRELEGVEKLWPLESHLGSVFSTCIDLYLFTTHAARQSALQTVVALRERGLLRDVAIMIARRVYDSRHDAVAWCVEGKDCS